MAAKVIHPPRGGGTAQQLRMCQRRMQSKQQFPMTTSASTSTRMSMRGTRAFIVRKELRPADCCGGGGPDAIDMRRTAAASAQRAQRQPELLPSTVEWRLVAGTAVALLLQVSSHLWGPGERARTFAAHARATAGARVDGRPCR